MRKCGCCRDSLGDSDSGTGRRRTLVVVVSVPCDAAGNLVDVVSTGVSLEGLSLDFKSDPACVCSHTSSVRRLCFHLFVCM